MDTSALEGTGILTMQNFPTLPLKGNGVLMGFIDTGIDYQNPVFQSENGTTRILRIWDQTVRTGHSRKDFSMEVSIRQRISIMRSVTKILIRSCQSRDTNGHGTFLAGVAAGSEVLERDFIGAAPLADIAVVKLKEAKQYLRDFYHIKEGACGISGK